MKKILSIAVVVVIIVMSALYFALHRSLSNSSLTTQTPTSTTQLQTDLQGVTPHFVDASEASGQTLTSEEQKIKKDVVATLLAVNPGGDKDYYSGLWLNAVGKRYILATQPSSGSSLNEIIDSQTGKVTLIPGERAYYLAPEGRDIALYIDTQAIHIYALDQSNATLVSGSQLSGNETYHSGTSDFQIAPVETHTKNSITISVFDSSQIVQNPDSLSQPTAMQTMNKKVRSITLSY